MEIQVQKWGDSLAIRIPASFALTTQIDDGSFVDLSISEGSLIAIPVEKKKYSRTTPAHSSSGAEPLE
ncbi:AbrB/MazE/SpoVT family DNA-binding domain-containing protein [candidate division KSB1 bacterium]|nr:AbrB/MazE/SpoVT family DNA-binding domain-containing protein [candidate division KSB1 bacterium]